MKIIFLDIDGVLNVMYIDHDKYGRVFHPHFVENLRRIIDETDAKIVITSTWRLSGLTTILNMWNDRNLPGNVIGITDNLHFNPKSDIEYIRGDEIQKYINEHEDDIDQYVILDDDTDMLAHQLSNFVQTSDNWDHSDYVDAGYGLTKECADKAIQILNQ